MPFCETLLTDLASAFTQKFPDAPPPSTDVLRATLDLFPKPLEDHEQVFFVKKTFEEMLGRKPTRVVSVCGEGFYDVVSSNKTLVFYLKTWIGADNWREWVSSKPNTPASQKARLGYLISWSKNPVISDISKEIGEEAALMLASINRGIQSGAITDLGVKTSFEKQSDIELARHIISIRPNGSVRPIASKYELFGQYLPPRRPSDFENFRIRETHTQDPTENSWSLSQQSFKFASFKNSDVYGIQIFAAEDVSRIVADHERFEIGIAWLNAQEADTRLFESATTYTTRFRQVNRANNNAYRHLYETVIAPTLSKPNLALLRFWLCHTASTAALFYTH